MRCLKVIPQLSVFFLVSFFVLPVFAEDNVVNLTIYNTASQGLSPDSYQTNSSISPNMIPGFAVVKISKEFDLKQSPTKISFPEVPAYIDPTTISFQSLTDPQDTTLVEQDYHFDLLSNEKLLERYLGQEITVEQKHGDIIESYTGKLLSSKGGLILQDQNNKIITLNDYTNLRFPDLPGGLMTKPSLVWLINAKKLGLHKIETSYQTKGMTWWTDYNALFQEGKDANRGVLDLSAWVSIINKSGTSFPNSKLKLLAGDVQKLEGMPFMNKARAQYSLATAASAPQFSEKPLFEFQVYRLDRITTLPDNTTKQIELFKKANQIPVEKQFVYNGSNLSFYGEINTNKEQDSNYNKKVNVYLKFKNSSKEGLGIPLPKGKIRVNKLDQSDNSLEFIGEDTIDHTPINEEIRINLGNAFDVVGERKQLNFILDVNRKIMEETIEISIKNSKNQDIQVLVQENMYRGPEWKISESSVPYEKKEAFLVNFPLLVKKQDQAKLKYTVRYHW